MTENTKYFTLESGKNDVQTKTSSGKKDEDSPQNSFLRKLVEEPLDKIIALLHETFPNLTPNQITVLGTGGLALLALYVAHLEKENKIDKETAKKLVLFFVFISIKDGVDGGLARLLKENGGSHDSSLGQLVDSSFDRIGEFILALLSMFRAAEKEDKLWFATATLAALANPLSSITRANAEKEGVVTSEEGENLFEFFGTSTGRFLTSILKVLPTIKLGKISAQALGDMLTAAATIKTASKRLKLAKDHKEKKRKKALEIVIDSFPAEGEELIEKKELAEKETIMKNAKKRFKILGIIMATTSVMTIIAFIKLSKKRK